MHLEHAFRFSERCRSGWIRRTWPQDDPFPSLVLPRARGVGTHVQNRAPLGAHTSVRTRGIRPGSRVESSRPRSSIGHNQCDSSSPAAPFDPATLPSRATFKSSVRPWDWTWSTRALTPSLPMRRLSAARRPNGRKPAAAAPTDRAAEIRLRRTPNAAPLPRPTNESLSRGPAAPKRAGGYPVWQSLLPPRSCKSRRAGEDFRRFSQPVLDP
jgi:hypothetical protein